MSLFPYRNTESPCSVGLSHTTRSYRRSAKEALSSLEKAIGAYQEPDQNTASAHNAIAHIFMEQGRADLAIELAQTAQREAQGKAAEWKGLFLAFLAQAKLGRWDKAEATAAVLKRKTELLPTEKEKRRHNHLMGRLALMRGETDRAIEKLVRAESMLPPRGFGL